MTSERAAYFAAQHGQPPLAAIGATEGTASSSLRLRFLVGLAHLPKGAKGKEKRSQLRRIVRQGHLKAASLYKLVLLTDTKREGPQCVIDAFGVAGRYVACMVQRYGADMVKAKLSALSWLLSTCFTGAGFAEVAAETLQAALRTLLGHGDNERFVELGFACDNARACQRLCLQRHGQERCLFGDVLTLARTGRGQAQQGHCLAHGRSCALHLAGGHGRVSIHVAGPPCPPWSRAGKRQGTADPRYETHEAWMSMVLAHKPDLIVFENLDTYDLTLLEGALSHTYDMRASIVDPRAFGIAMARPRVYVVGCHKLTMRFDSSKSLTELLLPLTARVVMDAKAFFAGPVPARPRSLTPGEASRMTDIERFQQGHRLHKADVLDLSQSCSRARGSLRDGALPTLTRQCGSMYSRSQHGFLSPLQCLLAMGLPVEDGCARQAAVPLVATTDLTDSQLRSLAGNGMSLHCVAAVLMVAALHTERRL